MVGAARPPKTSGQTVKCSSSTSPARNRASLSFPPPSQSRRRTPCCLRSQLSAATKSISFLPNCWTSAPFFRRRLSFRSDADSEAMTIRGEKFASKIAALGLSDPDPLTTTRRLDSARPLRTRRRRNLGPPCPRVTGWASTVRAPAMTASAVARRSSRFCWSRALPKVDTEPLAVAILPSAVIAILMRTNGRLAFGWGGADI